MTRYGKTMSQALAEMQMNELKMNDPKLNKVFDKLKPRDTIQLKVSSSIAKGKDFQPYTVKSKNTLRNGTEKISMILQGNPTGVKRFLYRKDGKVTFAIGDMAASIDDIKEEIQVAEGTWAMADTPKSIAALKKLMSKPLPLGKEGDDASDALYNLLGDDELSDNLYLDGKKNPKGDARKTVIKWFKQRVKDDSYGLGDKTKELGKAIGLKMDYVPEGFSPKEIKMAIGIASDPRYKQGNYTGAFKAIEKIKKGLASHPQVAAVLKRQNEERVDNFDENYRKLAMKGIGTETKKAAKVGLKTDYYLPKNGDKSFGKITRVSSSGYEITDEKTKKVYKFKFYDPNNDPTSVRGTREEIEEATYRVEVDGEGVQTVTARTPNEAEAKALRKMGLRGTKGKTFGSKVKVQKINEKIDPADVDDDATDADKKSAMKNMIMQMRQSLDSKGSKPIEFADGKSQKVDPKILTMLTRAHDKIQKPRDKEKFVTMISKSYRDMLMVAKKIGSLKMGEEVELDEGMRVFRVSSSKLQGNVHAKDEKEAEKIFRKKGAKGKITITDRGPARGQPRLVSSFELDEKKDAGKSASGYDIFHKDFSSAMQHATAFAKSKGQPIKKDEIDSKVATGPKKPSKGKENSYTLETEKGKRWSVQVYNMGNKFELNMYLTSSYVPEELTNEENEMTKSLKDTIVEMWSEAVSPAQQAAIAISKKEKEEQDEGNAFSAALQAAKEKGEDTFVVAGKKYDVKTEQEVKEFVQSDGIKRRVKEGDNRLKSNRTETNKNNKSDDGDGMDAVQPKAVKKKFKDRIDKDIDNDGDVDDSDKFLHKRRKAVSKAIKNEETIEHQRQRYLETKKGSLRDSILQMWGEKKDLTKEMENGNNKKTDTGKEMSKVEVDVKMPKVKESKNKV